VRSRRESVGLKESRRYLDPEDAESYLSTAYTYDGAGNRLTEADALGRTTHFEYDSIGRRTQR
jgi:uncharacterized protein RhaS with RHS repeats